MHQNTLLESALNYIARGWSVVPVEPMGKRPLIKWQDYQEQIASPETVTQWWEKWPDANIAVICGRISGLVVIDIDTTRGGDVKTKYKNYPTGLISKTGKGYHLFFNYESDDPEFRIKNKVGKDGIDIRADGGYVIVPPSVHYSGVNYKWVKEGHPGAMPDLTLESEGTFEINLGKDLGKDRWLINSLTGIEQGSRNDTCAKLAGYFISKNIPKDVVLLLLQQWNARNMPPLPRSEILTTTASVYNAEKRKAKQVSAGNEQGFNMISLREYMSIFSTDSIEWTIPGWLPEQTIAFMVAPPGTYKTWLLLDLAVSIAGGVKFLGHFPVEHSGPVLVIQQEDFHGQIAERLATIVYERYNLFSFNSDNMFGIAAPPNLPIYFHTDRRLRFDNKEIMQLLEERVSEFRPKMVMIDPLYSAASTEDYMAKAAENMFHLKRLRDKYQCSFLVAHHTKKSSDGSREGLWGSQFLNAFLETGLQISRSTTEDNAIIIRRHFKVKGDGPSVGVIFNINTENPPYKYDIDVNEGKSVPNENMDIINVLIKNGGRLTIQEMANKKECSRSTMSRKVNALIKDNILCRTADGKIAIAAELPEF